MKLIKSPMKFYNGVYGVDWTLDDLTYPIIATIKYNGEFVMKDEDKIWTRARKPFANPVLMDLANRILKNGMNAEVVIFNWSFHQIAGWCNTKHLTSEDAAVNPRFMIFDWVKNPVLTGGYYSRMLDVVNFERLNSNHLMQLQFSLCESATDVQRFYDYAMEQGAEGLVLRDPNASYKFGRTTVKERVAWKMISVVRRDAVIHHFNYSDNKPNMISAIVVSDVDYGLVTLGTGFDELQARAMFNAPKFYQGKQCQYSYRPHGMQTMPRQPVFEGIIV